MRTRDLARLQKAIDAGDWSAVENLAVDHSCILAGHAWVANAYGGYLMGHMTADEKAKVKKVIRKSMKRLLEDLS